MEHQAGKQPDNNRERGFTIFELLVTLSFVVLALFPLLSALSSSIVASAASQSNIIALNLASSKIEEIKSLSFNAVTLEAKAAVPNFPNFSRQVTVAAPGADLKDVAVIVYWTPSGGGEQSISLETYVGNF